ncbi:MAG: SDR family NAD(P)-dependent oxidoreductase [Alphaproteobacteria bacterium]|nr:SDR family NAD(P)-dependent oxidoreductase [Alphaproteobacteria bacterium]
MPPRVALVTGGNRGIGFEVCKQLAQQGHAVWLGSRDTERGGRAVAALEQRYGLQAALLQLDLSDPSSIQGACATLLERAGRVDVLVNNATLALDWGRTFLELSQEELRQTFEVNVFGVMQLCHALIPPMVQQGWGRVVNVSSGRGSFSKLAADGAAYRMSKTTLNALTRVLADELDGSGVLVNACTPGRVRTRLNGLHGARSVADGAAEIVRLATLPDDGPSGGFSKDGEPFPW